MHHVLLPNWPLIGEDFGSATVTCSYRGKQSSLTDMNTAHHARRGTLGELPVNDTK